MKIADGLLKPWKWALTQKARHRLEATFPLMRYVNLARREDRRNEAEFQFAAQEMAVERMPAVNGRWVRNLRGHFGPGQYGCAMSHRLILRDAELQRIPAVLIFEDDVVLHPHFRQLTEALGLPEDWEIFYFGCQHRLEPVPVRPGIVRVARALSTHAFAVRGSSLRLVSSDNYNCPQRQLELTPGGGRGRRWFWRAGRVEGRQG